MITPSFVHPASLRRDKRMRRLRATHGWLGYGLCLAIMEMLLDEPDQTLEPQYDLLASELGAPGELIRSLVEDFDLFVFDQPGGIRQFRSLPLPASVAPSPRPDEPQEPSCPSARATAGSGAPPHPSQRSALRSSARATAPSGSEKVASPALSPSSISAPLDPRTTYGACETYGAYEQCGAYGAYEQCGDRGWGRYYKRGGISLSRHASS